MSRWITLALLFACGCAHAPGATHTAAAGASATYGWRLLSARCQGCHALPDPRTHSREQWVKGIEKMQKRFAMTQADWDTILALVPEDSVATRP